MASTTKGHRCQVPVSPRHGWIRRFRRGPPWRRSRRGTERRGSACRPRKRCDLEVFGRKSRFCNHLFVGHLGYNFFQIEALMVAGETTLPGCSGRKDGQNDSVVWKSQSIGWYILIYPYSSDNFYVVHARHSQCAAAD